MTIRLPLELVEDIALIARCPNVTKALGPYMSQYIIDKLSKRVLIYGRVQQGKTKELFKFIDTEHTTVLALPNSLLILKQYIERLDRNGVKFQIVGRDMGEVTEKVLIFIKNKSRLAHLKKFNLGRYRLIVDEADQYQVQDIIELDRRAYKVVHVTSTPFSLSASYDRVIQVKNVEDYYGIDSLRVRDISHAYFDFLHAQNAMMLSTLFCTVFEMRMYALELARRAELEGVPVVLLNQEKSMIVYGRETRIPSRMSITEIIDSLGAYSHIVFVAFNAANRGLSFVSSDYTRHLTHQETRVSRNMTVFLQSLRIQGIYTDNPGLQVYLAKDDMPTFEKYKQRVLEFNPDSKLVK